MATAVGVTSWLTQFTMAARLGKSVQQISWLAISQFRQYDQIRCPSSREKFDGIYVTARQIFAFIAKNRQHKIMFANKLKIDTLHRIAAYKQCRHAYILSTRSTTGWAITASRLDCIRLASLGRWESACEGRYGASASPGPGSCYSVVPAVSHCPA